VIPLSWALDLGKFAACMAMLAYASVRDYKTREVSNWLWVAFYPLGAGLSLYESLLDTSHLVAFAGSFTVSSALSVALFYLGLYGGADAKAFIALSLMMPQGPGFVEPLLGVTSPLFPLSVFFNSVAAAALSSLVILFWNLGWRLTRRRALFEGLEREPWWKKALVMISCVKVDMEGFRGPPFQTLAERITGYEDGTARELKVSFRVEEDEEEVDRAWVRKQVAEGRLPEEFWVSPTLPLLAFIAFGFLVSVFVGDPLLWVMWRALGA